MRGSGDAQARTWLRFLGLAITFIAFLIDDHPSGRDALMAVIAVGVAIVALEQPAHRPPPAPSDG